MKRDGKDKYTFDDLAAVTRKLRSEGGCPWDRAQTHESLKPYLKEEAGEVLEAIDKARVRLDANVNFELAMELMLLTMKENIS